MTPIMKSLGMISKVDTLTAILIDDGSSDEDSSIEVHPLTLKNEESAK